MFKIISTEIKKIVSKPGIYILSVLLAAVLILGAFIYKPVVYESSKFELFGSTYLDKYNDFSAGSNAGQKAKSLAELEVAIQSIEEYTITYNQEEYSQKAYIKFLLSKFNENFDAYQDCFNIDSTQETINDARTSLVTSLTNLNSAIETALFNSQNGSYSLITSKSNYNKYSSIYNDVLDWAKQNVEKEDIKAHFIEFEKKYSNDFYSSINNFKYPTLSKELVNNYTVDQNGTRLNILNKRLDNIWNEIEDNRSLAQQTETSFNTKQADKMDKLFYGRF